MNFMLRKTVLMAGLLFTALLIISHPAPSWAAFNIDWSWKADDLKKTYGQPLRVEHPSGPGSETLIYKIALNNRPAYMHCHLLDNNLAAVNFEFENMPELNPDQAKTLAGVLESMVKPLFSNQPGEAFYNAGAASPTPGFNGKWVESRFIVWQNETTYALLGYLSIDFETNTGNKRRPQLLSLDIYNKRLPHTQSIIQGLEQKKHQLRPEKKQNPNL